MLSELINEHRIIVCCGTGGVGKTTTAASLGLLAARQGKNTLVLTIDPAKRLAQALGLDANEAQIAEVATDHPGRLCVSMLQPELIFEHFINQADVPDANKERLKRSRLYRQLTTTLSGSQEFTSLMWLQELFASGDYDLIILDTPPADHAVDFLHAPERIYSLFDGTTARFFSGRFNQFGMFGKLFSTGAKTWLKVLSTMTGAEFIDEASEFVTSIGPFAEVISAKARAAEALLKQPHTAFVLVASADSNKLEQARLFYQELEEAAFKLKLLLINRAYPSWLSEDPNGYETGELAESHHRLSDYFSQQIHQLRNSPFVKDNSIPLVEIPSFSFETTDINDLQRLVDGLLIEPILPAEVTNKSRIYQ